MQGYTNTIKRAFELLPCNHIIVVNELYNSRMKDIPEKTFYKVVGRLAKDGVIDHLTKGIYYKPKYTKYGKVPVSEQEITKYYTKNSNGVLVGYRMYNNRGITTQVGKNIVILSNNLREEKKNIGNIKVLKANLKFNPESIAVIEMLEILQNYKNIEDVNEKAFCNYVRTFAKKYSDVSATYVIENRKYKKSTIAFLRHLLDAMGVSNTLDQYLSGLSEYAIPYVRSFQ